MILKNSCMIKAIIFDFDGVIFDSEPTHWEACNIIFKQIGFTISYDEYLKKYVGLSDIEMFPLILNEKGFNYQYSKIKNLVNQKIAAYENIIKMSDDLKGINGLSKFLESSNQVISKFAICSGSARKELDAALSKIKNGNLKKYFELIITCEDVSEGKPSPEGYLQTAKKLNVSPENCLAIEDTKNGILAAKKAKMNVVGIATTNTKEALIDADFVVDAYEKINFSHLKII